MLIFLFTLSLSIAPPIFLTWYFYNRDIFEKEPKKLVIKSFMYGMLCIIPAIFLELFGNNIISSFFPFLKKTDIIYILIDCFIIIAPIEEYCKFKAMKYAVYNNNEFNEIMDGIVYSVAASCGFAALENIMYVFQSGIITGFLRSITAIPLHAFAGAIIGYSAGKAKFEKNINKSKNILKKGILLAIIFHAIYDSLIFIHPAFIILIFPLLWKMINIISKNIKSSLDNSVFKPEGYIFPIKKYKHSHYKLKIISAFLILLFDVFILIIFLFLMHNGTLSNSRDILSFSIIIIYIFISAILFLKRAKTIKINI